MVGEENRLQVHMNYIIRGATELHQKKGERIWIRGKLYSFLDSSGPRLSFLDWGYFFIFDLICITTIHIWKTCQRSIFS